MRFPAGVFFVAVVESSSLTATYGEERQRRTIYAYALV